MLFALAASLLASSLLVRADPTPTTPGGGAVYNQGALCPIGWTADTTGQWKNMEIQLMSGANLDMVPLGVVATVDGTDPNNNTFSYPCPTVSPNSAIYFYQFTDTASNKTYWTTRFTIADASGATTAPSQTTQPGGAPTPWGDGTLISGLASSGNTSTPAPATSSTPTSVPSSASAPPSSPTSAPSSKLSTSLTNTATNVAKSSTSVTTTSSHANSTSGASSLLAGSAPIMAALAAALAML